MIAVIECALNQNTRDCGAACFPAMNGPLVRLCLDQNIGILQIPCPEQAALGLSRARSPGETLLEAMQKPASRTCCVDIAEALVKRLKEHSLNGTRVVAIVGGNAKSPGCAVQAQSGIPSMAEGTLILAIRESLLRHQLDVPVMAMRDADPDLMIEDLQSLKECISRIC